MILLSGACVLIYLLFHYGRDLPDYQYLKTYQPVVLTTFVSQEGPWRNIYEQQRIFTPIEQIPPPLVEAFLCAEDKNFFYHFGLDIPGTVKAVFLNTIYGRWKKNPIGASTITQQVAKNFLVGNERSFVRKIKEAIMSIRLERALSKKRILELYLNEIFLGRNSYGIAVAAKSYFNKELFELSVEEMAFLATLPKAPSYFSKGSLRKTKKRRNWILKKMNALGKIDDQDLNRFIKSLISLVPLKTSQNEAPYAFDDVKRQLDQLTSKKQQNQGLVVMTTLDFKMQRLADESFSLGIETYDKRHNYKGPIARVETLTKEALLEALKTLKPSFIPKDSFLAAVLEVSNTQTIFLSKEDQEYRLINDDIKKTYPNVHLRPGDVVWLRNEKTGLRLFQIPKVNGSMIVINKNSGEILALVGGYDYALNQYNGATQALRQPGSAFKTLIYVAALESGYTPESLISDSPLTLSLGKGLGTYSPQNIDKKFYGPTPLFEGLAKSRNVMTVRLAHVLGMKKIAELTKRLGVMDEVPHHLSIALGAGSTTLLKLASAYACFANGGMEVEPTLIKSIHSSTGECLWTSQTTNAKRLLEEEVADTIVDMLEGVVEFGTARKLKPLQEELGVKMAAKTGTTNEYKDAWFIGIYKDLVIGVRLGYDVPMSLGEKETGGRAALPIALDFLSRLER